MYLFKYIHELPILTDMVAMNGKHIKVKMGMDMVGMTGMWVMQGMVGMEVMVGALAEVGVGEMIWGAQGVSVVVEGGNLVEA